MSNIYLSSESIAECTSNLIKRNRLWKNKDIQLFFIVNSVAGCFNNKLISKNYYDLFEKTNNEVLGSDPCVKSLSYKIFNTEYKNHATEITKNIANDIKENDDNKSEYIVISVGGDGTSLEVQTALYEATFSLQGEQKKLLDRLAIIRLPLGTGNDGTDGTYIEETFELLKSGLIYSNAKVLVAYTHKNPSSPDIKGAHGLISRYCDASKKSPWYSFNIASIGIDAFVCFFTNLVKSKIPGNLYQLCTSLGGLFYRRIFESGKINIEIYKNKNDKTPEHEYKGEISLLAMGTSGNKTYGGGQRVLPNFNNLCIATKVSLLRLIRDNQKFVDGTHAGTDIGNMFLTEKIKIFYDKPIMLQCDGECYLLCKEHFPLTIEKQDAGYKVLKKI